MFLTAPVSRPRLRSCFTAALIVLGLANAAPALAVDVIIDGFVKTSTGLPILNADIDWLNRDTGLEVDPLGDHTDASGYFSVSIPEGRYDVTVIGPPSNTYAAMQFRGLDLRNSQTLTDTVLPDGVAVTLTVQDGFNAPLLGIRILFDDVNTGDQPFLVNDRTDSLGGFFGVVPLGTYNVEVRDTNNLLAPQLQTDVSVSAPGFLGTFNLAVGHFLSGTVVDVLSQGIFNVNIDVLDGVTGTTLYTPGDNSDLFGGFSMLVPAGAYTLRFKPAPGSPFAAEELGDVVVAGPMSIPPVTLPPGIAVSGVLLGPTGTAAIDADVDVVDLATGSKRYVPGDFTDAAGQFAFLLPAGNYDLFFNPPVGMVAASAALWNRSVISTTVLPTTQMFAGISITGLVSGGGAPLAGVDLNFVDTGVGKPHPTPGDDTDALGLYAVRIPSGTYDVIATPGAGSGFQPDTLHAVPLGVDTVLDFTLGTGVTAVGDGGGPGANPFLRAFPNPFRARASIVFSGAVGGLPPRVDVFDLSGRRVRSLPSRVTAGVDYLAQWDGGDDRGGQAPAGIYFVKVVDGTPGRAIRVVKAR